MAPAVPATRRRSTPDMRFTRFSVVKIAVAVGGVSSIVHFADNATSMSRYPEPSWITPFGVWAAWIPIGALCAYLLLKRHNDTPFKIGAAIFAVVLLTGTLHFAYGSIFTMSPISVSTVLGEAACGIALLYALWRDASLRAT